MSLHRSHTVAILKKMSEQELAELGSYVDSGFCKASQAVKKACAYMLSCAPGFEKETCNKAVFSLKVFRIKLDKKLDKEINRIVSEMRVPVMNYITIRHALSHEEIIHHALMDWFNSKNLYDELEREFREVELS